MTKLHKFYELLDGSATVKLWDDATGEIVYEGKVKNIPDEYDNSTVCDFHMHSCDCFWIIIA